MAIRIRALRAADYHDVVALLRIAGLPARVRGRDSRTAFSRQLGTNRTAYLGAFDGDRLVGIVLGTHDTRKAWINRLAVDPEYRRQGIATKLVHTCERHLRAKGMELFAALVDDGNRASETLFERLGYERLEISYFRKRLREGV